MDTKQSQVIDPEIIEELNKIEVQLDKSTLHKPNSYEIKRIVLPIADSTDYLLFDFNVTWSIKRCRKKEGLFDNFAENGWYVTGVQDKAMLTTFGKSAEEINKEIKDALPQLRVEVDLVEDPTYCPVCDHCGEVGCCGFTSFLEKHVRGKTNCLHEQKILDELEKWIEKNDE